LKNPSVTKIFEPAVDRSDTRPLGNPLAPGTMVTPITVCVSVEMYRSWAGAGLAPVGKRPKTALPATMSTAAVSGCAL
jgi:hypothetical protein